MWGWGGVGFVCVFCMTVVCIGMSCASTCLLCILKSRNWDHLKESRIYFLCAFSQDLNERHVQEWVLIEDDICQWGDFIENGLKIHLVRQKPGKWQHSPHGNCLQQNRGWRVCLRRSRELLRQRKATKKLKQILLRLQIGKANICSSFPLPVLPHLMSHRCGKGSVGEAKCLISLAQSAGFWMYRWHWVTGLTSSCQPSRQLSPWQPFISSWGTEELGPSGCWLVICHVPWWPRGFKLWDGLGDGLSFLGRSWQDFSTTPVRIYHWAFIGQLFCSALWLTAGCPDTSSCFDFQLLSLRARP